MGLSDGLYVCLAPFERVPFFDLFGSVTPACTCFALFFVCPLILTELCVSKPFLKALAKSRAPT